jgi:hypothetical protein
VGTKIPLKFERSNVRTAVLLTWQVLAQLKPTSSHVDREGELLPAYIESHSQSHHNARSSSLDLLGGTGIWYLKIEITLPQR